MQLSWMPKEARKMQRPVHPLLQSTQTCIPRPLGLNGAWPWFVGGFLLLDCVLVQVLVSAGPAMAFSLRPSRSGQSSSCLACLFRALALGHLWLVKSLCSTFSGFWRWNTTCNELGMWTSHRWIHTGFSSSWKLVGCGVITSPWLGNLCFDAYWGYT